MIQVLEISFISSILLITIYFHVRFDRFAVVHGPEVLTTLGILGCFTGITIALFNFNPSDIAQSVPNLLAGIRTAFWASLAGVFGSLTLRFGQRFRTIKSSSDSIGTQTASLSDIVISINSLTESISSESESSLISQTKFNREEASKKSDELILEFKLFAEKMVENNQKAIIEALKEVIKDFNTKLSEQFGDNFKQLNLAIGKLLDWQIEYKKQLEAISNEQKNITNSLNLSSQHLNKIVKSAGVFEKSANELRSQIEFLNLSREMLISQQSALANVLRTMKDVTPTFAEKTTSMLNQVEQGMINVESKVAKISDEFGNDLLSTNNEMKILITQSIKDSQAEIQKTQAVMTKVTENLGIQMQISSNELKKQMSEIMIENQQALRKSLLENVTIIREGVVNLDRSLQKELNDSLEALGRQLASLSNRFVEDYSPLTEKLKKIVEISKKI
jgi:hypothetical protein